MDPNSGKIYHDPTQELIERRGLVEVSERVAGLVEAGRCEKARTCWKQRKNVRRKKAAVAKASRRANRK